MIADDNERSPAILTIDLGAVASNWRLLAELAAPARCGAVVKADAYGLGAIPVVRALLDAGCREFFVAHVEEGIRLREGLYSTWPTSARIHVLHGALPGAEHDCVVYGLIPVLNSVEQIRAWRAQARREGSILPAAIQGDTGMARLGLAERDGDLVSRDADALEGIAPTLVMSHLVSAEDPLAPVNQLQLMRFRQLRQLFPQAEGCLANSSAIFLGSEYHFDLVRPGAALYGVAPTVGMPNPLKPVIRVQARLLQWRNVEDGAGVGYNHTWQARRATRIGTISIGYADGFLRSASNSASVRFSGRSLPVIGRVSMDTVTVDVTEVPPDLLVPGALFDVIDEIQDINELARQAGTNAYEILTSLGARYRRHYASEQ